MVRVFVGAALLAAGIVAFIEAHSHKPLPSPDITKRFKGYEEVPHEVAQRVIDEASKEKEEEPAVH